jgi:FlaA1/EpsC-like NDP-sugar epimerase
MNEVLLIGGAGSLGKAFARYLHNDYKVTVLDSSEWSCAELEQELPDVEVILKDMEKWSFAQNPCNTVVVLAAYKHLPLGEKNTHSFIENNLVKTGKVLAEAYKHNVNILFISSDKAVEPISAYGYTKALGECLTRQYEASVARLGNIINSSGSVIPVWEKAIEQGKPLRITDPDMTRYMIHEDDAVKQIWEQFLKGEKLIIPDMPEPIKLIHLAQTILELHKKPIDYPIEIIGIRKGEKMSEKLKWDHE